MDLTGSIAQLTQPFSAELSGSVDPTGSSAIDTILNTAFILPNLILAFIGGLGGDLGSTGSTSIVPGVMTT